MGIDIYAVVGLQYGSEGKGLLAGYLAKKWRPDAIVTAWAPNAGHTFTDKEGNKFVSIALPSGLVSDSVQKVLLGPGSCIDPVKLDDELGTLDRLSGGKVELYIHEHAAVIEESHKIMASGYSYRVGGVMKGGGEALMAKMRREVDQKSMPIARERFKGTPFEGSVVPVEEYNDILDKSDIIQIEGAQGFSLGLNQGFYPYGTWRDCSIAQVLSDCAIPMSLAKNIETIGVCRTYPIRVANRYANDGKQIGWSGPCYYDQHELTWEQIGVPPEFTTVSGLKRRVFSFSREQIRQAIRMNDVARVFLNFRNYPMSDEYLARIVESITETGASIWWEGFGPREDQIMEAEDADA